MELRTKGQINIEFAAAALIYIISLGGLVLVGQGIVPEFSGHVEQSSLNLEAKQVSDELLSTPGRHSFGDGGTDWDTNSTTIKYTSSLGIASEYMDIERGKLESLRTFNPRNSDRNYLNYSEFREITGVDHQYQYEFVWMPVIETNGTFTQGEGTQNSPPILEPDTEYYRSADNTIHYGSEVLNGSSYHFLVTSHDGIYNTSYVSDNWNFRSRPVRGPGDTVSLYDEELEIKQIQNREREPGSLLLLSQKLKTFGASTDSGTGIIRLERYAIMEDEPLRVNILAW